MNLDIHILSSIRRKMEDHYALGRLIARAAQQYEDEKLSDYVAERDQLEQDLLYFIPSGYLAEITKPLRA